MDGSLDFVSEGVVSLSSSVASLVQSIEVHTYAAICIEKLLRVRDATPQAEPLVELQAPC